ncbi:MAG: hypothetical protein ACI38Y_06925, partial [Candidatus Methanomethylophilaceae archaeon]
STLNGHEGELMDAVKETGVGIVYYNPLHFRNVDPSRMMRMGISGSERVEDALVREGRSRGLDIRHVFKP